MSVTFNIHPESDNDAFVVVRHRSRNRASLRGWLDITISDNSIRIFGTDAQLDAMIAEIALTQRPTRD